MATRAPLPPATGVCHWLADAPNGNRRLVINGTQYEVDDRTAHGTVTLYRDDPKSGGVKVYKIDQTGGYRWWRCNCDDATGRPERRYCCKHVRALKAAYLALPF